MRRHPLLRACILVDSMQFIVCIHVKLRQLYQVSFVAALKLSTTAYRLNSLGECECESKTKPFHHAADSPEWLSFTEKCFIKRTCVLVIPH